MFSPWSDWLMVRHTVNMDDGLSSPAGEALPGSSQDQRPNVGILLRDPYQEVVRRVSAGLVEAGFDDLRPAHTAVFQHIEAGGSRLTELAERAQMTKQSMGYLVDYLEEHGYLERRPDPSDRRAALVCLTERGWEQIRAALGVIADLEAEWTTHLGEIRMEQLRGLLAEVRQIAGAPRP